MSDDRVWCDELGAETDFGILHHKVIGLSHRLTLS